MIAPIEQVAGRKSRLKIAAPRLLSVEEAEAALHEIAVAANEKRQAAAEMDAELLAVKDKYQPALSACQERMDAAGRLLSDFAATHPEIFPKNRKSVEWAAGKFGFRTDTPSLCLANRAFGWAKILGVITAKRLRKFVRTKIEVDKEAILARCGTLEKPTKFQRETLPVLGIRLVQEEQFFVEPDLSRVETRVGR